MSSQASRQGRKTAGSAQIADPGRRSRGLVEGGPVEGTDKLAETATAAPFGAAAP